MYTKLRSLLGKYIRYLDSGKRFVLHYIDASGFNFNVRLERINKISPTYIAWSWNAQVMAGVRREPRLCMLFRVRLLLDRMSTCTLSALKSPPLLRATVLETVRDVKL